MIFYFFDASDRCTLGSLYRHCLSRRKLIATFYNFNVRFPTNQIFNISFILVGILVC